MKKLFILLVVIITTSLIMALSISCAKTATTTTTPAPPKTINLIFGGFDPKGSFLDTNFYSIVFAELEKRTNGKVHVETHWNGELVGFADAWPGVVNGTVDMAQTFTSHIQGRFMLDQMFTMTSYDSYCYRSTTLYNELYNQFPEMAGQYSDVHPVWIGMIDYALLGNANSRAINTMGDAKGLKCVAAGGLADERQKAIGMVPTGIGPGDVYTGLERGTIDVCGANMWVLQSFKWWETMKSVTLVPMYRNVMALPMNIVKWNSLPDDVKKVFNDMNPWITNLWENETLKAYQDGKATCQQQLGLQLITLTPAETARWAALDQPIIDKMLASIASEGFPAQKIWEAYKAGETKYRGEEYINQVLSFSP
jgi:TRAP-type C4-dicarboxylate transport system substrate-binding protein